MRSDARLARLQGAIAGEVLLPGTPGYQRAYPTSNARFDAVRPQAVVRCASPEDVAETIALARREGLPTASRSGGHGFAGHSTTAGVLVDVGPMHAVSLSDGVARVGAGARLGEVYERLGEQGLAIPAGSCPSVGIAGLTLGGGLGILGRKHGLTCDHLLGAQVVLADGSAVDCDDHHHEELFWALRGAGAGNFGVVTSLAFRTVPAPSTTSFRLVWPYADAAAVVQAWMEWAPSAPDELAASLVVAADGEADQAPSVEVFGVWLGGGSDAAGLLGELVARAGAEPASASSTRQSFADTRRLWAQRDRTDGDGDAAAQAPRAVSFSKSEFFQRPLPGAAVAALLDAFAAGRPPGQYRELDFSPWGGAYNRVRPDATAFVHRQQRFLLKHAGVVDAAASVDARQAAHAWVARSWASVHRWGSGQVFQNFADPDLPDWARAYYGTNLDRLVRAKRRYDPDGFFRFQQSL